jgi:hypothetical protein
VRSLLVLAGVVALVALLYYATFTQASTECEVCVRFEGREACQTAAADSREAAEQTALSTACAKVSSGVTGSIGCTRNPPASVSCRER